MKNNKNLLRCFSPAVMVITFSAELFLVLFVVLRYKWSLAPRRVYSDGSNHRSAAPATPATSSTYRSGTPAEMSEAPGTAARRLSSRHNRRGEVLVVRSVVIILLLLAAFQVSEFFVCAGGGLGFDPSTWSKVGFVAITFLPSAGLLLMHQLAKKNTGFLVATSFLSALGLTGFFLFYTGSFRGSECTGNYVIFQLGDYVGIFYSIFYSVWLLATLLLGFKWLLRDKTMSSRSKKAVTWLIVGYFSFMLPTAIAINVNPSNTAGVPSIMCGFALLFALILVFAILPKVANKK